MEHDRTLFPIGSITKLFVWTAVMQLVERGDLDLDTDVNAYLRDVQVPASSRPSSRGTRPAARISTL